MTTPTRDRITWGSKSATGPVLPSEAAAKRASAHPQTPDEGITHPAGYKDPTQPNAYENGDTSSWAEDPFKGPVRTSPQPANPMDDGGYRHPAAQPGAPGKNASRDIRAATELKATKCIKVASAILGTAITKAAENEDKVAVDMIEAQALDLMDLPDARLASTLRRIEAATADPEVLLRKMLAEEEGKDPEAVEEEEPKKEASTDKLAEITSMLANLQKEMAAIKSGGWGAKAEEEKPEESEEDKMLASMMAEEAPAAAPEGDAEAEAMLAAMLAEEAPAVAEPAAKTLADYLDEDVSMSMDPMEDPMGVIDDGGFGGGIGDDDAILATLFASKSAEEEPEEEEKKDEPAEKQAGVRVASINSKLNPQPKKPGQGARTIGSQHVASNVGDVSELARLWDSAPDVSSVFGK